MTIDNLLEADIVTADGRVVTVYEESDPDLFWAIRGGGGNFGIVTRFRYRLHPVEIVTGGALSCRSAASPPRPRRRRRGRPDELTGSRSSCTLRPHRSSRRSCVGEPADHRDAGVLSATLDAGRPRWPRSAPWRSRSPT